MGEPPVNQPKCPPCFVTTSAHDVLWDDTSEVGEWATIGSSEAFRAR